MNIKSTDLTNSANISSPLKNKKYSPSFSGHVLTKDVQGNNIYKFFLPNAPDKTKVVLTRFEEDKNGLYVPAVIANNGNKTETIEKTLSGDIPVATVSADDLNLAGSALLGYKFVTPDNRVITDTTAKNGDYAYANPLWVANSSRPRVMYHLMPDSFNILNPALIKRNHFNVMGGTLNSINDKVEELSNAGFTSILGLPVFGQDNKSSHGYWTTNAYQITNNLGSLKDFKNLILNMYKHDMRWTADGAFVNEGIEGIHVTDIGRWGADSPFVSMFETKDVENLPTRFGVMSKNRLVNKHIHFKLVNAPYKIEFAKGSDGQIYEKSIKHRRVDPTKPTYVQVFDDRLATIEQMNSNDVFSVYDIKETQNNFEIANYRDSVQPYYRNVSSNDVIANYNKYVEAKYYDKNIEFKNLLTKWSNFEFVDSNKDGGVSLWVGNSDISKKQFFIPEKSLEEGLSEENKLKKLAAQYQVQDDTIQIGKYWTNEVARTLTEYTARVISDKVKNENITYATAVQTLIKEGELPKGADVILEKTDGVSALENVLTSDIWDDERNYKNSEIKIPQSVTEGIMSFPFDAIEFAPDLVSVFSYPYIKNLSVSEDTVGKSRFEMFEMGDFYYNQIPNQYRDVYKEMDNLLANDMKNLATNILQKLADKKGIEYIDSNGSLTTIGKEMFAMLYPDIAKFIVVTALSPKTEPNYSNKDMLEYHPNLLKKISLNSLNLQFEATPEDTAKRLIEKLKSGMENISSQQINAFVSHLNDRVQNVDSDAINVAKLIIDKTESGLDWRIDASKDVCALDSQEDGLVDEHENQKFVMSFWKKFNDAVRQPNPHSYTIGELTDWSGLSRSLWFTLKSHFSTITDYDFLYSVLPAFYGHNSEGWGKSEFAKELNKNTSEFLDSGFADGVNYMHRFAGNHDKPRILHLLSLDMGAFNVDKTGVVADALVNGFKSSDEFNKLDKNMQEAVFRAINTLRSGHVIISGVKHEYDNENFGVRPFDFDIEAVIKEASEENNDFAKLVNDSVQFERIKKIKAQTLQKMLESGMEKYRALWFAMQALPGTPTHYAGDELGMTGWETSSKNEKQEVRNALHWDWLYDKNYSFISDFKAKIDAVSSIRKKDGASALANGAFIQLNNPKDNVSAFYRYNDKTDAVCVLHAIGFDGKPHTKGSDVKIGRIDLGGLPNGLKVGTIYVDAMNPSSKYKVTNQYEIKKVDDNNTDQVLEEINLGNAGLILLREESFNGKKFSFKGRIQNPNVEIANLKYNIAK